MQPYIRKACGPCISLKARCDNGRPCERCARKGVECVDVERKPRQKKDKLPTPQNLVDINIVTQLLQNPNLSPQLLQQQLQILQQQQQQQMQLQQNNNNNNNSNQTLQQSQELQQILQNQSQLSQMIAQIQQNQQISNNISHMPQLQQLQMQQLQLQQLQQLQQQMQNISPQILQPQQQQQIPQMMELNSHNINHNNDIHNINNNYNNTNSNNNNNNYNFNSPISSHSSLSPLSSPSSPLTPEINNNSNNNKNNNNNVMLGTSLEMNNILSPSQIDSLPPFDSVPSSPAISSPINNNNNYNDNNNDNKVDNRNKNKESGDNALPPESSLAAQASTGAMANAFGAFVEKLKENPDYEIYEELLQFKNKLESFVDYMESSRPKEVMTTKGIAITNPAKEEIIECNAIFCEHLGYKKGDLIGKPIAQICVPFYWKLVKRDLAYLRNNVNIASCTRAVALQHTSGGVVYGMAEFSRIGPTILVITLNKIYQDMPYCLKIAFDHYLGLASIHSPPPKPCDVELCHCKLLHLPLLPD